MYYSNYVYKNDEKNALRFGNDILPCFPLCNIPFAVSRFLSFFLSPSPERSSSFPQNSNIPRMLACTLLFNVLLLPCIASSDGFLPPCFPPHMTFLDLGFFHRRGRRRRSRSFYTCWWRCGGKARSRLLQRKARRGSTVGRKSHCLSRARL